MTKLTSRVTRGVASVSAGLVLAASVGVVGASSIHHHDGGEGDGVETSVTNTNNVDATNNNEQNAVSGNALVDPGNDKKDKCHRSCDWDNEDPAVVAGDATTGDASNDNTSDLSVTIDNSGACGCLQGLSTNGDGNGSVKTTITNTNTVGVTNNNLQNAVSGNATVNGNGGSASTGNASNSNNTTVTISISN